MNMIKNLALCAALAASATAAQAAHVTTLSGGSVYTIPALNLFTAGPHDIAPGITWTADNSNSVFGWTGGYGFSANGFWSGSSMSMIGTNSGSSAMRIDFAAPVSGVLAFLNYAPFDGSPAVISVFDSANTLLDSYTLTFSVNGLNTGEFHGFQQGSANISYMTLAGQYVGASSLQVNTAAVPEAGSIAMVLGGLAVVAGIARRRNQAA